MHPKDVKISRLTQNLMTLAEGMTAFSEAEAKRYTEAYADVDKSASFAMPRNPEPTSEKRGRAAVVSWDLCHNPAGRAYVLYELLKAEWDVDLIGPMWSRYGSRIWGPLQNSGLNIRSFPCHEFSDFIPKAEALVSATHYDIVYVCKPRLPSMFIGALIKEACHCPLILDVDDFELSFFKNEEFASIDELKADIHGALHQPFEELATRYVQNLISSADSVTVSNVALRQRFSGHMVRHARDEKEFRNSELRRAAARKELRILADDFALVFIGTPRAHKGVLQVAKALEQLNDPHLVFHIIGDISDKALKDELLSFKCARVVLHPNCPFDALPDLLAAADLVPLLQDVAHAVSQYQIPAKISDALSLGVPVVATSTPPLADVIASGAIHKTDVNDLPDVIRNLKAQATGIDGWPVKDGMNQERQNFLSEFGMGVNRARLEQAISEAMSSCHSGKNEVCSPETLSVVNDEHLQTATLAEPWREMVSLMRDHYRGLRGEVLRSARERRGEISKSAVSARSRVIFNKLPSIIRSRSVSYDIAYFWKQNDSNLYGRRSDMIVKELVRSGRVGKLLHLDAPLSASSVSDQVQVSGGRGKDQQDMITSNLLDRQMGIYDSKILRSRTHLFSRNNSKSCFLAKPVSSPGAYVRFVHEQLEDHGMRARDTVAWFCPVIWDAPELIEKIGFRHVISDLIDDQRAWDASTDMKSRLDRNYCDTLAASDLVFANCDSLANAMHSYVRQGIHVVPNGAERFMSYPEVAVPELLKNIRGPIVGYVGNLRDRIDWALLHEIVPAMPDVSFVFFGPSSNNPNADSLAMHENVHVLGIVPYDELAFHLKAFDVGLVPHLNNQLTDRMNPLKIYNYFAAGLPIVSSEIANLADLGSVLKQASNADEFICAIRSSLENPIDTQANAWQKIMDEIAWESRVGEILDIMDQSLHRRSKKTA